MRMNRPNPGKYDHLPEDFQQPPDHEERLRAAERFAQWHLGDASWGRSVVGAYMYPRQTMENLDLEQQRW